MKKGTDGNEEKAPFSLKRAYVCDPVWGEGGGLWPGLQQEGAAHAGRGAAAL